VACRCVGEVERESGVVRARPRAALGEEGVEQSALVEDFEGADVEAARSRFRGAGLGFAFEDLDVDSGEPQFAGEHEPGGPGPGDHHLGLVRLVAHDGSVLGCDGVSHRRLIRCVSAMA
jgi:hypothetical protein